MRSTVCAKCGSSRIIPEVMVEDRGNANIPWDLSVRVDEKPHAVLFKGRHSETLRAWICGDCGYTELYVSNPQELYIAYAKAVGG